MRFWTTTDYGVAVLTRPIYLIYLLIDIYVYNVWGIHSNTRDAANTVLVRLGWLHASKAGLVVVVRLVPRGECKAGLLMVIHAWLIVIRHHHGAPSIAPHFVSVSVLLNLTFVESP
jgi:hypothetical protein